MSDEFRISRLLARVGIVLVLQAAGGLLIGVGTRFAVKHMGYDGFDALLPMFGLLGAVELTLVISIGTAAVRAWLAGRRDIGAGWLIGLGLGVIAPSAIYLMMSFGYLGRWPAA